MLHCANITESIKDKLKMGLKGCNVPNLVLPIQVCQFGENDRQQMMNRPNVSPRKEKPTLILKFFTY